MRLSLEDIKKIDIPELINEAENKIKPIKKINNICKFSILGTMVSSIILLIVNLKLFTSLMFPLALISGSSISGLIISSIFKNNLAQDNRLEKMDIKYKILYDKYKFDKVYKVSIGLFNEVYIDKYNNVWYSDKEIDNYISNIEKENKNIEKDEELTKEEKNGYITVDNITYKNLTSKFNNKYIGTEYESKLIKLQEGLISKYSNPIIIGKPGVGKTTLVEILADNIIKGNVPEELKNKEIYSISASDLVSGCTLHGMFEKRTKKLIDFAKDPNKIIFIDEFHQIINAGKSSTSNIDVANILKPYLSTGEIKIIGATTKEEYENCILEDTAFASRFEKIEINEPDNDMLYKIVLSHIDNFEKIYKIKFIQNDNYKNIIISSLIDLTQEKNRNYNDIRYNPRLIINILEKSFVKALVNNNNVVTLENICQSINDNNNIYDSVKSRKIEKLEQKITSSKNEGKSKNLKITPIHI